MWEDVDHEGRTGWAKKNIAGQKRRERGHERSGPSCKRMRMRREGENDEGEGARSDACHTPKSQQ